MSLERHASTPGELKARLEWEQRGEPFLQYRDPGGHQQLVSLGGEPGQRSIGRDAGADISLPFDRRVSRLHATLERVGGAWTVTDDGLSRNGTFVNLDRLTGRRLLRAGDIVRVGETDIAFHDPSATDDGETSLADDIAFDADLSRMQRSVLAALCRPLHEHGPYAAPATNRQIAEDVHLSEVAVKTHLRTLFAKFGLADLPQNRKRAALAEAALRSGAVTSRDFGS